VIPVIDTAPAITRRAAPKKKAAPKKEAKGAKPTGVTKKKAPKKEGAATKVDTDHLDLPFSPKTPLSYRILTNAHTHNRLSRPP